MSDFTTPVQFESNAQATVNKLNEFINQAVVDKSFLTGKDTLANADLDILNDLVLIYDASASNLKNTTSSVLVNACLTNKFRGKIYAPATSTRAGININSDEVTGDIVPEPGDLVLSEKNILYATSDNKFVTILDNGENYITNPVLIKQNSVASLYLNNPNGENYNAMGVNNLSSNKTDSFNVLWSGNVGINTPATTTNELSVSAQGILFKDGTKQITSGNVGTGLPNTLVENGETITQKVWYNWEDPNKTSTIPGRHQEVILRIDWGSPSSPNYVPEEQGEPTWQTSGSAQVGNYFAPIGVLGDGAWRADPSDIELDDDQRLEDEFWIGDSNDPGNPYTKYKGYRIYKINSFKKSLTTIDPGDVHTANTNSYNVPQRSWMHRDNSTGFIQQWILYGSGGVIDPPQNLGTNENPVWNKVFKLELPTAFPNKCFGVTVVPERSDVSTAGQFSTPATSTTKVTQYGNITITQVIQTPEVVKPALYGQWNADIDVDINGNLNTINLSNSQLDFRSGSPHGYFRGAVLIYAYGY